MVPQPLVGQGLLIVDVSLSHSDVLHSVGLLWTSDRPVAENSTCQNTTLARDTARFEPTIPASERPQTHALDCEATGTGNTGEYKLPYLLRLSVVSGLTNGIVRLKCDGTRAKPDFVFRRNGRVHLNRRGRQFVHSTAGSQGVRITGSNAGYTTFRGSVRVLATHSIRQFPLHFPTRASPCAIRFQTHYTKFQVCRASATKIIYTKCCHTVSLYCPYFRNQTTTVS